MNRREIIQKFEFLTEKFPDLGDSVLIAKLIKGKNLPRAEIEKIVETTMEEKIPAQTKRELIDWYCTL